MTIPFLDLFKKLGERFSSGRKAASAETEVDPAAARPRVTRPKKTAHPSFSKTVLPHRTRSLAPPDPFQTAAGISQAANPSMQLTPGRVVTSTTPPAPRARELPRALALALEPKLERAVSLRISDFIDQIPAGFIKPVEILDVKAIVSLKASEIEKGMAEGKPSVSLVSLYQQLPEIFLRSVPVDNDTRVALPYDKVYAQFKSARVREDQETDPDVPQVDTPILQVTLEETKKFGTKLEPLQTSALPSVPVQPATAETLAKAEPEPVALGTSKPISPVSSPHPVISLQSLNLAPKLEKPVVPEKAKFEFSPDLLKPAPKEIKSTVEIPSKFPIKPPTPEPKPESEPAAASESAKTEPDVSAPTKPKIEFPPNGTGVPASERVPASTGPPVPINLSTSPPSIPFKSPPAKISDAPASVPPGPAPAAPAPIKLSDLQSSIKAETTKAPASVPPVRTSAAPAPIKLPVLESSVKPETTKAPASVPPVSTPAAPSPIKLPDLQSSIKAETVKAPAPFSLAPIKLPVLESLTEPETAKAPASVPPVPTPAAPAPIKLPVLESLTKSETAKAPASVPPVRTSAAPAPIKLPVLESLIKPETVKVPAPVPTPVAPSTIKLPVLESKPAALTAVIEKAPAKSPVGQPSLKPTPTPDAPAKPAVVLEKPVAARDLSKVSLSLKQVLQNLPIFQLNGDASSVPEDVRIGFPLLLVEPQLAKGRVAISPEVFQAAIPDAYRSIFQPDVANTPVLLPLQEVLKNLPEDVLKVRPDQERIVAEKEIETPFSIRAKEDAAQFNVKPALMTKPAAEPEPKIETKSAERIATPKAEDLELEPVSEVDVKEVMTRTGALAGVKACAITFSDGLNLAGALPPQMKVDGLCAMAPSLFQKIDKHIRETKLGNLVAVTMHSETAAVSFFAKGNICLAVLHGEQPLAADTRGQIADLVEKLSRTYTHPEISHVDH